MQRHPGGSRKRNKKDGAEGLYGKISKFCLNSLDAICAWAWLFLAPLRFNWLMAIRLLVGFTHTANRAIIRPNGITRQCAVYTFAQMLHNVCCTVFCCTMFKEKDLC